MTTGFTKFVRMLAKRRSVAEASDWQLVVLIQQQDAHAWATFLDRYTDVIYRKAWEYSRTNRTGITQEDRETEAANLYLFMADYLKHCPRVYTRICANRSAFNFQRF